MYHDKHAAVDRFCLTYTSGKESRSIAFKTQTVQSQLGCTCWHLTLIFPSFDTVCVCGATGPIYTHVAPPDTGCITLIGNQQQRESEREQEIERERYCDYLSLLHVTPQAHTWQAEKKPSSLQLFFSHSLACSLTLLTLFISPKICPSLPRPQLPQIPQLIFQASPHTLLSHCPPQSPCLFKVSRWVFSQSKIEVSICAPRGRPAKQSINVLTKTWWEQLVLQGWSFPRWPRIIHSRPPTVCQMFSSQF